MRRRAVACRQTSLVAGWYSRGFPGLPRSFMNNVSTPEKQALNQERREVLQQLEDWMETPMLVLSFAWLALFVIQLTRGLTPLLEVLGTVMVLATTRASRGIQLVRMFAGTNRGMRLLSASLGRRGFGYSV